MAQYPLIPSNNELYGISSESTVVYALTLKTNKGILGDIDQKSSQHVSYPDKWLESQAFIKRKPIYPKDSSELFTTHIVNDHLYSNQLTSAVNQLNTFSTSNINQQLLGFSVNKSLNSIINGGNSHISRRTVLKTNFI